MLAFKILRIAIVIAAPLVLGGWTWSWTHGIARPDAATLQKLNEISRTPKTLAAFFRNTTHKSYNKWHGTQIEYLSASGKTYLVYPGNAMMLRGEWMTRYDPANPKTVQMCYRYGKNTYNPVLKTRGGNWDCEPGRIHVYMLDEVIAGDPLGMRKTVLLPRIMPKGVNVSIAQAMKAIGRGRLRAKNKVSWNWRARNWHK